MYRFLLRPKWLLFHVAVILLVVVMVQLGFWQLHRLQGRRAFNAEVVARTAEPVVQLTDLLSAANGQATDPSDIEWRTVEVTGTYLTDEQVVVINRSQGGTPGVDAVTPLQLDDGTLVVINRGFVPESQTVPAAPTGPVSVIGRVRATERRHLGGLTDPEGRLTELQRLDIDRLAQQLPGPVAPVSVELVSSEPKQGLVPVPVVFPELGEGPHMSYMIQWWCFSAAAIIGWVLAVRRSARLRQLPSA